MFAPLSLTNKQGNIEGTASQLDVMSLLDPWRLFYILLGFIFMRQGKQWNCKLLNVKKVLPREFAIAIQI